MLIVRTKLNFLAINCFKVLLFNTNLLMVIVLLTN